MTPDNAAPKCEQKCGCGLQTIPAYADGVSWYWQLHKRDICTLELPNSRCWCGLLRSEHLTGHADKDSSAKLGRQDGKPDIRASFEHYFSEAGKWPAAIDRNGESYKLMQAHSAWTVWKAAAQIFIAAPTEDQPK